MTTKQIAEAVGKSPATVARWVERTSRKMQQVAEKIQAAKRTQEPADYSLEETIAIIETGMGKNAADVYRANAQASWPLANHADDRLGRLETLVATLVGAVAEILPALRGAHGMARPAPAALPPPAELEPRDALRKIVEGWARSHGRDFHGAWSGLYREYGYRYHRDIARAAKNRNQTVLDYADDENIIGELLALAYFLYAPQVVS